MSEELRRGIIKPIPIKGEPVPKMTKEEQIRMWESLAEFTGKEIFMEQIKKIK